MISLNIPTVAKLNGFQVEVASPGVRTKLDFIENRNGWHVFERVSVTAYEKFRMEVLILAERFESAMDGTWLPGQGVLAVTDCYGQTLSEFDF